MVVVWLIVIVALVISLYNFIDSRDLNQLTATVQNIISINHTNKRYSVYSMRKTYNNVMLVIVAGLVALFGLTLGTQYTMGYRGELPSIIAPTPIDDTTLLSLYEPPKEDVPTLPPSYSIKSESGSGGQNEADQEAQEKSVKESTNPNDSPNETQVKPEKPKTPRTSSEEINAQADHFEKTSEDIKKRSEERKANREKMRQDALKKAGNNVNGSNGNKGSTPETKQAADFDLDGRTPFNNDNWYLQYPTYTCQKGGTITLKIKVDDGGYVKYAEPLSVDGIDPCVVENARKYAKKARFNASSKPMQEGTITYKFKAQ